jgi:uracil-DNA glycosylase family 4
MIPIPKIERVKYFDYLLSSVNNCDICSRMCTRKKVLSVNNGNLYSKVVFIAEAPGRLGAECTGIPLYGDKTGENFEILLGNIGWKRDDVFITNSILCNPQDEKGNNSTPTQEEIENCSYYLEMTLKLVNPDIIVTLGVKALEALKYIENHNYILRDCVAQKVSWNNKYLFPIYHMGPRAAIHRSINKQRSDFMILSHIVDPIKGIKKHSIKMKHEKNINLNNLLLDMVVLIVTELKVTSFFKLTKLLYLIDYYHYKDFGNSMSGSIYLRMQDGPWIPTLKNIVNEYKNKLFLMTYDKRKPILSYISNNYKSGLTNDQKLYIHNFILKYEDCSDVTMKITAYRTEPMRYILSQEKIGRNMSRIPVLFKNSSILETDRKSGNNVIQGDLFENQ